MSKTIQILPHVVAKFKFTSDSTGCAPLKVEVANKSTGGSTYLWDLGNGNSRSIKYLCLSTITIILLTIRHITSFTLKAMNSYGCDSTLMDSVVRVCVFVNTDFNLPLADSCSPFVIHPTNLSSSGSHIFDWDVLGSGIPTNHSFEPVFPAFTITPLQKIL